MIRPEGRFYHGQPVMITRNNNQLKLFNGDVGLILSDDQKDGELSAVFRDGSGRSGGFHPNGYPNMKPFTP